MKKCCQNIHVLNHIFMYVEKLKNNVIQREECIFKESRRHDVSVLINHHQGFEKMISSDVRSDLFTYRQYLALNRIQGLNYHET